jgi:hypothetical protein
MAIAKLFGNFWVFVGLAAMFRIDRAALMR